MTGERVVEIMIPPRLLQDARDPVSLEVLDLLGDRTKIIDVTAPSNMFQLVRRMCRAALGGVLTPIGELQLVVHMPREPLDGIRTATASTHAGQVAEAIGRLLDRPNAGAVALPNAGAVALPMTVSYTDSEGEEMHAVVLMADPAARLLTFYDPHGAQSKCSAMLLPMLTSVSERLAMPLRRPCDGTCGIQEVHGGGLCAWYSSFVATLAMLAWHRGGVPVHTTVDLLTEHARSDEVYHAFRAWATNVLWVWSRHRDHLCGPFGKAGLVNVRQAGLVNVRRDHEERLVMPEAVVTSTTKCQLAATLEPVWVVRRSHDGSRIVETCTTWALPHGLKMVVIAWNDEHPRRARVIGQSRRDRTVSVEYVETGVLETVPFHFALWGK